jgi:hypothetical protein
VREASGAKIVKQLTGRDALVVPDPTILLGDFSSLLRGVELDPQDTIFCYALRSDAIVRDVAEMSAQHLGFPVISPRNSRQRWRDIGLGIVPGPVDWLRHLVRSRAVVSNSFHGIALAIIHNKPFIAVSLPGAKAGMNARVLNLLESTGLMGRFVTEANAARVATLSDEPIDWADVNTRLAVQRSVAEDYLRREIVLAKEQ